jgi:hypothetical protein
MKRYLYILHLIFFLNQFDGFGFNLSYVQRVRKSVKKNSLRVLISPRASIKGAKLLAIGIPRNEVELAVLWIGLDENSIRLIKNHL